MQGLYCQTLSKVAWRAQFAQIEVRSGTLVATL
jgi:hypothetical protein